MKPINLDRQILIPMDLGFFNQPSAEKTEKATPKKREKAREEGQVAQSQEIGTAVLFVAAFASLRMFAPGMLNRLAGLITTNFQYGARTAELMETQAMARHIWTMFGQIILIFLPVALVVMALGLMINLAQVGWKPTFKPMQPKFSKMSPAKGIKKIFSLKILVELVKTLIKFSVILAVVYFVLVSELDMIAMFFYMDLWAAIAYIANVYVTVGITIGVLYIFVAAIDFTYNKFKHEKDLRMTKQEIKDEYKQAEGDPMIKGRIRQKMRETSMRRMMQEVPGADVVITNPTHFACVIKYNRLSAKAPVLVAKGADNLAHKIRDIANENEVMIVENKPLARTLYSVVDVGDEIPAELWQAVAEILAYVYSVREPQLTI
ncbi:MAG: flagellar biosynthesis protein FlhB [Defluviitaleaceae bacterium]|nr:flagellar biosynthesis protein FlhB [Defluviitaleaceae bacterium]